MDTSKHMKGGEGEDSGMRQPTGGRKGRNRQSQNDHQDGGNDPLKMGGEGEVPKAGGSGDKYMGGGKCMKVDGSEVPKETTMDESGTSIMKCPAGSTEVPDGGRRRRRKSRKARKSRKSRKGRKSRKH